MHYIRISYNLDQIFLPFLHLKTVGKEEEKKWISNVTVNIVGVLRGRGKHCRDRYRRIDWEGRKKYEWEEKRIQRTSTGIRVSQRARKCLTAEYQGSTRTSMAEVGMDGCLLALIITVTAKEQTSISLGQCPVSSAAQQQKRESERKKEEKRFHFLFPYRNSQRLTQPPRLEGLFLGQLVVTYRPAVPLHFSCFIASDKVQEMG